MNLLSDSSGVNLKIEITPSQKIKVLHRAIIESTGFTQGFKNRLREKNTGPGQYRLPAGYQLPVFYQTVSITKFELKN